MTNKKLLDWQNKACCKQEVTQFEKQNMLKKKVAQLAKQSML